MTSPHAGSSASSDLAEWVSDYVEWPATAAGLAEVSVVMLVVGVLGLLVFGYAAYDSYGSVGFAVATATYIGLAIGSLLSGLWCAYLARGLAAIIRLLGERNG
jgi:hypothetical protein